MNVEIRDVPNKGKGIFALYDFNKGELVLNITGEVIETEDPQSYPEEIREHWGPLGRDGKKYRFITPESPWMYMNHSCDSNVGIIDDRKLVAARDIKKGEEILIDYSALDIETITFGKKKLEMECKCGSKNCRHIITTYDLLDKQTQDKLKPFLNSYLRTKYLEKSN